MLKIATIVRVLPMPMRSRQVQNTTTSQTALTGVPVYLLILLQRLPTDQERAALKFPENLTLRMEEHHLERKRSTSEHWPAWRNIR